MLTHLGRLRGRRWRFQFQLRTLLLVFLIVALGLAWWLDRRALVGRIQRLEDRMFPPVLAGRAWGVEQATGSPDTNGFGDLYTAWASQTPDVQQEWLLLRYAKPVRPTAVIIHETYNPGSLIKVSVFDPGGREVVVWTGRDPTSPAAGGGVSTIPVSVDFSTDRVKIYLDSPRFPGWNEIDAVGLRYWWGRTIWATKAEASSSFAGGSSSPGIYPGYGTLR
ncbi:MAG: hypothetical protein GXY83_00745 [Rhodopirellula sp.]|nr:hypothetical protein [Rhodopirellula sp.]